MRCPAWKEVPLSGFGYPLSGFAFPNLRDLFQSPTLLGLTLQSFDPLGDRRSISAPALRFRTLLQDLFKALKRYLSDLISPKKPYFHHPEELVREKSRMLSWACVTDVARLFFGR
jgi:hypothetical protein